MNWIPSFNRPPKDARSRCAAPVLVLCSLLFLVGCGDKVPKESASDFTLELFEGGSFTLSKQHGHPVVINFFASWCIPCKAEAPALDKVYKESKIKGVAFLGIAVQDTVEKAKDFVKENGITFPAGLDQDGTIKESFGVYGVPVTYFIDKNGIINYIHAGILTEDLIRYELDKIL